MGADLQPLMRPRSVAIVGASPSSNRGNQAMRNLMEHGFEGAIYPVNPRYEEVLGRRCFPFIGAIGSAVDLVIVATPGNTVPELVEEAGQVGVRAAIVPSAGFAEYGPDGARLQREMIEAAGRHGMTLCGPNCLGVISAPARMAAMASSPEAVDRALLGGNAALVSQSGGLLLCVLELANHRGLAFRYAVSSGNEAVTSSTDYVDYLLSDADVRVLLLVLEGIRDGRRFRELALKAIHDGKRIVLLKLGTSPPGQSAAAAHTASLAGEDRVLDGLCRQAGIIRVYSIDQLVETGVLLSKVAEPMADGVAIVGVSGGTIALVADSADRVGLHLPPLPEDAAAALRPLMPDYTLPANPLDGTGGLLTKAGNLSECLRILDGVPDFGLLLFALPLRRANEQEPNSLAFERLLQAQDQVRTPLVAISVVGEALGGSWRSLAMASPVPALEDVGNGVQAVGGLFEYWRRRQALLAGAPSLLPSPSVEGEGVRALGSEFAAKRELGRAGMKVTRERLAGDLGAALDAAQEIGWPVALKVQSPDLPHKAASGGIALGIASEGQLRQAWADLHTRMRERGISQIHGILVQEMIPHQTELLLGGHCDPVYGPVVAFGVGGVHVNAEGNVIFRPLPLQAGDAEAMSRAYVPDSERPVFEAVIKRFAAIFEAWSEGLASLEINPLVLHHGRAVALDALAVPHVR